MTLLNLDDRIAQIDIAQGTLNLRVRRIYPDQLFEIDTPNLAFSIRRAGDYRVDVDPAGNRLSFACATGRARLRAKARPTPSAPASRPRSVGEGLRDYSFDPLSAPDEFDNWCLDRDRREDAAVAARYISPDIVGYSDLDDNGSWRSVEGYGNVWFPTASPPAGCPITTGTGPGSIPGAGPGSTMRRGGSHRFTTAAGRMCSALVLGTGPIAVRPVYAPALVAFVGGGGFSLSLSTGAVAGIAWFPLGPGEVYRPGYAVSRNYFNNVNVSNTVVNTTVINNVYNNINVTNIVYKNRDGSRSGYRSAHGGLRQRRAGRAARRPGVAGRDRARSRCRRSRP